MWPLLRHNAESTEAEDERRTPSVGGRGLRPVSQPRGALLALAAMFVIAYVVLDWLSYVHPVATLGITPWNPTAGLSLYFLLRFGARMAPAILVAAFAADVVVRGAPAQLPALLAAALLIAVVYGIAARTLVRRLGHDATPDSAGSLTTFLFVVVPASFVLALSYVGLYTVLDLVPRADFLSNVSRYWIGDLNGLLVVAPALLANTGRQRWHGWPARGVFVEALLQAAAIALALWAVFGLAEAYEFRFFSLLFLPLVWIGVRHGLRGATLALAAIQLGLIIAVQVANYHTATFIQLQFLMVALSFMGLMLGVAVTERQATEARLQDKQAALNRALQLAAAGEMASALAHELNQPIAAIGRYLGACEVLVRSPERDRDGLLAEAMGKAVTEARRASEVVKRLRDFYRSGTVQPSSIATIDLIQSSVQAIRARAELGGIRLSVDAPSSLPAVHVDSMQIETVLLNLLNNAIDAVSEVQDGRRRIDIAARATARHVDILISDSGPGIAPDVRRRLFEPFTTSKAAGMGMGLAMSRSLIEANGGQISFIDQPTGARFAVSLPRATEEP